MKKLLIVLIIAFSFFSITSLSLAQPEEPKDKLVQDAFLTVLIPNIEQALDKQYGTNKRQFDLWNTEITGIQREQAGGYTFTVKLRVYTFVGAHNPPYDANDITFQISPMISPSTVKLTEFKHKEVTELPQFE